jgi:uncharacterized cupredoxin-like copper-binding protein
MLVRKLPVAIGALALCLALAYSLGFRLSAANGQPTRHSAAKPVVINVTAGKPNELAFTLSKYSNLPPGPVTFKVTNRGTLAHDFKLCTVAVKTSRANLCAGRSTPMITSGKTATITMMLTKPGIYEFLCTVAGHAAAGMKGLIGIGVKVSPPPKATPHQVTTTTASSTTTSTTSTTTTVATATCSSPQNSTVTVSEFDFGFTVTPSTVPCGNITFQMTNTGQVQHNFDIGGHAGALIDPGQSTTMTVSLNPGSINYVCDVPQHAAAGMFGKLTVSDSH